MRKVFLLSAIFLFFSTITFASFPIDFNQEITSLINLDPKFNTLGFLVGILSVLLLPFSLIILVFLPSMSPDFKNSMWLGAGLGLLLLLLILLAFISFLSGIDWGNLFYW